MPKQLLAAAGAVGGRFRFIYENATDSILQITLKFSIKVEKSVKTKVAQLLKIYNFFNINFFKFSLDFQI
jgi:hypothetical protein